MPSASQRAEVISVNVGASRAVPLDGRTIETAIWKQPVEGRVAVAGDRLAGDRQVDIENHGGPDMAVYAYASEDAAWWEEQVGASLDLGAFGENLTTRGLDVSNARVGERWAVGSAVLEVRQPRIPCFKLGLRMGDPGFPKRFARAGRPGALLGIVQEGEVAAGDPIEILSRPDHDVTVALVAHIRQHAPHRAPELLAAVALPDGLRAWASRRL